MSHNLSIPNCSVFYCQTTSRTSLTKAGKIDGNSLIQVVIRIGLFVAVILSEINFRLFNLIFYHLFF